MRKDLLRRHERRHEKGMWFRNSGGVVESEQRMHDVVQHEGEGQHDGDGGGDGNGNGVGYQSAMFTEREQEDDVRVDEKMLQYEHDPEPEPEHEPASTPEGYRYSQMGFQEQPFLAFSQQENDDNNKVTSLFFDPSISIPDPALDFEWLFDNLSADMPSVPGVGVGVSPQSSASLVSPPAFASPGVQSGIRQSGSLQSASPWAEVRAGLLKALSGLMPDILMSSFFYPNNLAGFWDLYFENYHPHFPILHRPTLDPVSAPPLLVAAIVTLGSTLSSDAGHFDVANKIHDSLRYIIFAVSPQPSAFLVVVVVVFFYLGFKSNLIIHVDSRL